MESKKHRLVIVSLDAVGKRDMNYLMSLPNFSEIVNNGAFCDNVYSVYPSLTYPAHTSIVTGRVPNNHRIVTNTRFQPSRSNPDWLYKRKYINGTTIVDEAKKAGYTICSFLWPVMGGAKIDYNLPEVMVTRKFQNQIIACALNGTPKYLLELNKLFGHLRKGIEQPYLDDFLMACTKHTIEKYDPDMMLIHFTDVDTNRHKYGVDNKEVKSALKRHDDRLGEIKKWLLNKGGLENTTFVVLGDHCQISAHTIVYLNKYLLDKGLITVRNGKISDYKVIAKTCDGSTYLYLNPKYENDIELLETVAETVREIKKDERLGIEAVYTSEEAMEMGADGDCLVMFEGKRGYYFLDEFEVLTEPVESTKNHKMFAIHGCLPTKEENLTFFAMEGKGVKKGARVDKMHLWDEGPTIAKIMGWHLNLTDGETITDFIE